MKLDPCCVRDVALAIEDLCGIGDFLEPEYANLEDLTQHPKTSKYSKKELVYTLNRMHEACFLKAKFVYDGYGLRISRISALTYDGHKFLDCIRNDSVFSNVLKKLSQIGTGVGIDVIKTVAAAAFKSYLNL